MLRLSVLGLMVWSCTGALAQTPAQTEHVTVTGTNDKEVVRSFVDSLTAPTLFTGKIARWETPICPYVTGTRADVMTRVMERLKAVAKDAGVRISSDSGCAYNIAILFTTTPQALMDDVRQNHDDMLGYAVSSEEKDRLAQFVRPIQAWYVTATRDRNGATEVDSPRTTDTSQTKMVMFCGMSSRTRMAVSNAGNSGRTGGAYGCAYDLPRGTRKVAVEGSMLGDKTHSLLDNVLIVADPSQIAGEDPGAMADYIAMLALAQIPAPEDCRPLPSIINLLAKDCSAKTAAMTDNDRAYLRGLYQMDADRPLDLQRGSIANEMMKPAP
jgi:hypothetical protein